jgi:hypothetical protein
VRALQQVRNYGGTGFSAKELALDLLATLETLGHPGFEDKRTFCLRLSPHAWNRHPALHKRHWA